MDTGPRGVSDLASFLLARLDEEQQLAERAAKPHHGPQQPGDTAVWQVEKWVPSEHEEGAVPAARWVTDRSEMGIGQVRPDRGIAEHIARWDPARVLAEITAKRAIINGYTSSRSMTHVHVALYGACCRLAAIWADHPDFDPLWAFDDDES